MDSIPGDLFQFFLNGNLVVGLFDATYFPLRLPVGDHAQSINHRNPNAQPHEFLS
jgi:hypothetical protein